MSQEQEALYDTIAERYRDSKQLPFRYAVERYTLFRTLGGLQGRTVLDLACGEGFYTEDDYSLSPGGRGLG